MKGNKTFVEEHLLLNGWQCKQRSAEMPVDEDFVGEEGWIPAQVPGCVHLDLMAAGRIPDPFPGLNENKVQWVGESDWLYRCVFDLPDRYEEQQTVVLCCEGLDTFALVWLNGKQVASSDNMFVPLRIEVGSLLRPGQNELNILFESALRHGKQREEQMGQRALWNGDSSRLYVRKAQYHYGWDWGPTLLTAGPWRAVRLEVYRARIADLHCPLEVSEDLQSARLPVLVELEHGAVGQTLRLELFEPGGKIVEETTLTVQNNDLRHIFTLASPRLWWPNGYGEQARYRLVVTLCEGEAQLDRREQLLGLRRLRLVQRPLVDQPGTSFFFEINNTPIFCGGANWIPGDSFLSRITPERYRAWLKLAADGNMVMVRVWGGGIYEEDIFYDLCDELGLLVWQDFLFGCGVYPAHAAFQESVRAEAEANLRRLRHHPSIVLWCGNNEDYAIADQHYDPDFNGDFLSTQFPARAIYERLLPAVCEALDPTRPYWPGSPFGGPAGADPTIGDVHVWNVWQRPNIPYQDYPEFAGRFVSEYGMEAFPALSTIVTFASSAEQYPQSRVMDHHNKATGGPRLLVSYILDNVRLASDLEGYIYASQFIQAEAVGAAVRGWRRRWQGPGREYTAGALVWQLNDCWPVISWAIVDYEQRPKPAYYVMKRELAPLAVGLARITPERAEVWVVNGTTEKLRAELEVRTWRLDGSLLAEERHPVELAANQASELLEVEIPGAHGEPCVLAARLLVNGEVRARGTSWPEPFKYLQLPEPEVVTKQLGDGRIEVSAVRPAKGVWLASAEGDVTWSDNMLDLFPGDPQLVRADGLKGEGVQVKWLR
jgi:beta-mannosidase